MNPVQFFLISISMITHSTLAADPPLPSPQALAVDTCFSPDEACDEKLASLIASAKKSVDVAVFDINLDQVVHQILVQSRRIAVRVLVDKRQSRGQHSLVPVLIKGGARVRTGYQRGIMHHKFVIVDGTRLMTGSFNFTNGAAFKNQENQLYINLPKILERYNNRFEKSWNEAQPVSQNPSARKRGQDSSRATPKKNDSAQRPRN
ncbi:MAG: phospholipase D-like domain-containing protein [Oligoflexia bacterium]|jgi:cardiolipin hydrolase